VRVVVVKMGESEVKAVTFSPKIAHFGTMILADAPQRLEAADGQRARVPRVAMLAVSDLETRKERKFDLCCSVRSRTFYLVS